MKCLEASFQAAFTSGGMRDPPQFVIVPAALMMGLIPRASYTPGLCAAHPAPRVPGLATSTATPPGASSVPVSSTGATTLTTAALAPVFSASRRVISCRLMVCSLLRCHRPDS